MKHEKLVIGVKYCGHCNPEIDGVGITQEIQKMLEVEVVSWDCQDYNLLLIISVCSIGCVTKPYFAGPRIEVAGRQIREWTIPGGHLGKKILAFLKGKGFEV